MLRPVCAFADSRALFLFVSYLEGVMKRVRLTSQVSEILWQVSVVTEQAPRLRSSFSAGLKLITRRRRCRTSQHVSTCHTRSWARRRTDKFPRGRSLVELAKRDRDIHVRSRRERRVESLYLYVKPFFHRGIEPKGVVPHFVGENFRSGASAADDVQWPPVPGPAL